MFFLINSPNSKDMQFTLMYDTEKLQILTFDKLQPTNVSFFFLKK